MELSCFSFRVILFKNILSIWMRRIQKVYFNIVIVWHVQNIGNGLENEILHGNHGFDFKWIFDFGCI